MAVLSNSLYAPPPLQTPITAQREDHFGTPYDQRDVPAADLNHSWAQWFNAEFNKVVLAPRMVSTVQANLTKLASFLTAYDAAVPCNFTQSVAEVTLGSAPFLVIVTDYGHVLQWNGTGWQWGPGEPGSGMLVMFEVNPGSGWQLYDGSTVNMLKSDGTTQSVVLPDLTSAANLAAYLKAGSPNGGPNAAVAPGFTGGGLTSDATGITATTSASASTVNVLTSSVTAVSTGAHTHAVNITDPTHTHTFSGGAVDATGEPQNLVRRPYFRL